MNKKLLNLLIIFMLLAAFIGLTPVLAETGTLHNLNNQDLSDNLNNSERLAAHLGGIREIALQSYKSMVPAEVETAIDDCLAIVKQLADKSEKTLEKTLDELATLGAIWSATSKPKSPLISPLQYGKVLRPPVAKPMPKPEQVASR